jgi:hypothetical protein
VANKIPHGSITRAALAVTLLLMLAGAGAGLKNGSAAPSTKFYSTTLPASAAAGTTFTADITLSNSASSSQTLGAEDVVLPVGYTAASGATPSAPAGKTWNAVTIGSRQLGDGSHAVVQLRAKANGDALEPGTSVSVGVSVTIPCALPADTSWKTEAKQSNSFSGPPGNDFQSTTGTFNNATALYSIAVATTGSCSFRFVDSDLSTDWTIPAAGFRAGTGFPVNVEAVDGGGNVRTSFDGTATMSGLSNSPNGDSPTYGSDDTGTHVVTFSNGISSFTTTAVAREHTALTATSGTLGATSSAFDVWPGDPAALTISSVDDAVVDTAISPAVTADVFDAYGNKENCASCTQASVSLQFGTDGGFDPMATPTGSPLTGAGPVTSVDGTATFNAVTIGRSGTGFTLKAVSGAIGSAPSNEFTVFDGRCVGGAAYSVCSASKNHTSVALDYPTPTIDATLLQLSSLGRNITCGTGSSAAIGALVTFTPAGKDTSNKTYTYSNPIQVTLRWDKSVVPGTGVSNFTLCLAKPPANQYQTVQDCPAKLKPTTVLPCASKRSRNNAGDLVIVLKMGSGDPIAGLH